MVYIKPHIRGPNLHQTIQRVSESCPICIKSNPKPGKLGLPEGIQRAGEHPGADCQVDFTQMPKTRGCIKYLLVFIDTFSGWVEAFQTRTEKSQEVTKVLLKEIIPRYGLPSSIQSDNRSAFIAEITETISRILGIKWKLHSAWRPRSIGKTKKMNHTLKKTLPSYAKRLS